MGPELTTMPGQLEFITAFSRFNILPGGSGGGWVQSLLPCPGSWSSSPPSPGSISYLAVAEEDGSRADHHARAVWSLSPPHPGSLFYLAVAEEDGSRADPMPWSLALPSPGSLSYLGVAEEQGSRADHHARAVGVQHCLLQAHYPILWKWRRKGPEPTTMPGQ
jgi:hypothetical protein